MPQDHPFFPIEPFCNPLPGERDAVRALVDQIGLYLICPRATCRRGRRCRDPEPVQLPFCFFQHRGKVRFVVAALVAAGPRADADEGPPPAERTPPPPAETLLGRLRAAGIDIDGMARSRADGADEWTWERSEAAQAFMASRRARRPPEDSR